MNADGRYLEPRAVLIRASTRTPARGARENLRKYLIAAIAALTAMAFAGVALAQTNDATMKTTLSPKKAGSKKQPANSSLKLSVLNGDQNRTMSKLTVFLPKTLAASGKGFKTCTKGTLDSQSSSACPKGSKVGSGTAVAILGVNLPAGEPRQTLHFDVTVFVGGKDKLNFYLHSVELGFNITAPGKLSKASGAYGRKLAVQIPKVAQSPDNGHTWAGLVSLDTTLKGKAGKHKLLATTGCKHHKQGFKAQLTFINNGVSPAGTVSTTSTSKCK